MANTNHLPDLSTLDIQAIQDSVESVMPRFSLPPLTTIAENWDAIEPQTLSGNASRAVEENDDSNSSSSEDEDQDIEDEEESQSHNSRPKKIGFLRTCSTTAQKNSSSSSGGDDSSISDGSNSDLTDATSDSDESSSSSTSESDSDSVSSNLSSCSSKNYSVPAKNIKTSQISVTPSNKEQPAFSVREANFDQGRVTLRLSSLHLGSKGDINVKSEIKESMQNKSQSANNLNNTPKKSISQKLPVVSKDQSLPVLPSKSSKNPVRFFFFFCCISNLL